MCELIICESFIWGPSILPSSVFHAPSHQPCPINLGSHAPPLPHFFRVLHVCVQYHSNTKQGVLGVTDHHQTFLSNCFRTGCQNILSGASLFFFFLCIHYYDLSGVVFVLRKTSPDSVIIVM